jgi:predicted metal-dependent phosphoesterase TrpH
MMLGDFHIHSTFSDGKLTIAELVDLYGAHGFGVIAITDHLCEEATVIGKATAYLGCTLTRASFPEYLETIQEQAARAWRMYRMLVLPGFELTKNSISNQRSAHIVGIGVDRFISADSPVVDLARAIRSQGGLAIAAHPVWTRRVERQTFYLWDRREALRNEFDAWEIASGAHIYEEVAQTNLPKIASSDLHHPRHMDSWKTVLDCEKHPEAVLRAIREQQVRFRFFRRSFSAPLQSPQVSAIAVNPLKSNRIFTTPPNHLIRPASRPSAIMA